MRRDEDDTTAPNNGGGDNTAALVLPAISRSSTTIRIRIRQKRRNNYKSGKATTSGSHQSHIVIIRIYIDIL